MKPLCGSTAGHELNYRKQNTTGALTDGEIVNSQPSTIVRGIGDECVRKVHGPPATKSVFGGMISSCELA